MITLYKTIKGFRSLHVSATQHLLSGAKKVKAPFWGAKLLSAPEVGIEPTTNELTARRSTAELLRNIFSILIFPTKKVFRLGPNPILNPTRYLRALRLRNVLI